MLLTCPECTTRYEVATDTLGGARAVRCTVCGTEWLASTGGAAEAAGLEDQAIGDGPIGDWPIEELKPGEPAPALGETLVPGETLVWRDEAPEPAQIPSEAELRAPVFIDVEQWQRDLESEDVAPVVHRPRNPVLKARIKVRPRRAPRKSRARAAPAAPLRRVLGAAFVAGLVLFAGAFAARESVVAMAPGTARLFAAAGLPVNLRGLEFRDVASYADVEDGLPVLAVEGEIVNLRDETRALPALRLGLRQDGAREVYAWTIDPPVREVGPGESVRFKARLAAPPPGVQDVLVRFVPGVGERVFGSLK